jgi:hypothetical protein
MLNINNLHSEIEKRENRKNKTYQTILEKVQYRIITVNKKSNDCYCFYLVPTFIFGVPLYDMTKCIIYIMEDLIGRGFKVNYTHPNLLYISWKEKPKQQLQPTNEKLGLIDSSMYNNTVYHPTDIKTLEFKTDNLFN